MSGDVFARRVQVLRDQLATLERRAESTQAMREPLLTDALALLHSALAELRGAEESLAQRQPAPASATSDADAPSDADQSASGTGARPESHTPAWTIATISEVSRRFVAAKLDLQVLLETISHRLVELIGDACIIRLISADRQWLEPLAVYHADPQRRAFIRTLLAEEPLRADEGVQGQVVKTGQPLMLPVVEQAELHAMTKPSYWPVLDKVGLHSLMIVPLQTQTQVIGTLIMSRDAPGRPYTDDDLTFLRALADRAALSLDNARLYREAQEQSERFRVTLSSIGDAVIATDTSGCVTFLNAVAQTLTGWPAADAVGQPLTAIFNIINESSRAPAADPVARVIKTGAITELANHTILIARDGTERTIDDSGAPIRDDQGNIIGVVLVFRDVSQHHRLEADVRQSRDQLDVILRGIVDGITVQDPTGRLVYANDAAAQLIGYPSAEALLATPLPEVMQRFVVMDEAGRPFPTEHLPGRIALQGQTVQQAITRFRVQETGEERWSILKATPVFDEHGQVRLAINMFHDITAIKQAEIELQVRARQQSAVAELGQRALADSDLDTLLDEAVALVARTLEVELTSMLEVLPNRNVLQLRAGMGWNEGLVGHVTVSAGPDSVAGYTLASNQPVIIENLAAETRYRTPLLRAHHVVSGMNVAIREQDQVFGVLSAHTTRRRVFTEDDVHFLQAVASTLAEAILRRRVEQALNEQRERFEVTLSSIGDAVIATDNAGRITFVNHVAETLTGWTRDEACGQDLNTVFQIVNETTRLPVESPSVRVLREGVIVGLANHTILIARDGVERPIDDSGAPIRDENGALIGVVLVFRDITERKRAENAQRFLDEVSTVLAQSLNYELTLAQLARLAVPRIADWCAVDMIAEDGSIQRLAVEHVDPQKVAWAHDIQRRYPADLHAARGLAHVLRTGESEIYPLISEEMLVASARDAGHLQLMRSIGFTSAMVVALQTSSQVLGAITLVSAESGRHYDADDLALAEELAHRAALAVENARLYRDAQSAIRVRDQFLSIASHELKTPLTVLLGNTQLLQRRAVREGSFGERNQRALNVISAQAERLNKMIAALLDISRIQIGQMSIECLPFDLGALLQRVVAEVQPALDHHTLECIIPDEPLVIVGDALRIEQVLQNLIGNAIKYSPAGGPITVRVEQHADRVSVAVTDQGIGIPELALPNLFSRFYRASNVDPQQIAGMGIGLFVVKEIIALHGGEVTVSSTEGVGSTFTIWLPLTSESVARDSAEPPANAES